MRLAAARRVLQSQENMLFKKSWSVPADGIVRKEDAYPRVQFIFDVLLARGTITQEYIYQMNRGFQYPYIHDQWNITGDWTQISHKIKDWTAIP